MRRNAGIFDIVLSLVAVLFVFVVCGCTAAQQERTAAYVDRNLPAVETTTKTIGTTATTVSEVAPPPISSIASIIAAAAAGALALEKLVAGAIASRKPNPPPVAVAALAPIPAPGPIYSPNTAPISAKAFGG